MSEPECLHGIAEEWCALCLGTVQPAHQEAAGAGKRRARPSRATKDADVTTAELVAAGTICGSCLGEVTPGCLCSRRDLFAVTAGPAQDWLHAHQGELSRDPVTANKVATGIAFAVTTRAARRAGFDPEAVTEMRDDLLTRFEVEPKWSPFRRSEANHLPV
jgi:hypothetical protein